MNAAEDYKQRRDRLNAVAATLQSAAADYARVAVSGFRKAGPKAFELFDKAYCAGLVELKVEATLSPDGAISRLHLVATSRDGRRTELT